MSIHKRPSPSAVVAGFVCGLSVWGGSPASAVEPIASLAAPFLNDGAIAAAVTEAGRELVEAGDTPSIAALREQFDRATCPLPFPAPGPAPTPAADADASPAARAEAATLILSRVFYCEDCEKFESSDASGFVISPDGLAVTNYHVLDAGPRDGDDRTGFVAVTRTGEALPIIEVLAADRSADVALVRLGLAEGRTLPFLPLAEAGRVGEDVHCVSHPAGRYFTYSRGVVTRRHLTRRAGRWTPRLTVTADYARGSSGAAMVNAAGEIVGLVTTTDSVYYTERGGRQRDLQMVFRDCVPVESLRALFAPPQTVTENADTGDAGPDEADPDAA